MAIPLCQIGSKTLKTTKKKEKLAAECQFLGFLGGATNENLFFLYHNLTKKSSVFTKKRKTPDNKSSIFLTGVVTQCEKLWNCTTLVIIADVLSTIYKALAFFVLVAEKVKGKKPPPL